MTGMNSVGEPTNADRVMLVDAAGNYVAAGGGGGGGGDASAANQTTEIGLLAGGLPAGLGAHGGMVVEGVASGTPIPVTGTFTVTGGDASAANQASQITQETAIATAAGTPSDSSSTNSFIGLLKKLIGLLPTSLGGHGALVIEGVASGTAIPVSAGSLPLPTGAATAANQITAGTAGTPSAQVMSIQGESGMTAVKTDGSGVTQPVSASTLPLPTGAATAAKQPALGTAGSASMDVITIQGAASMTAVKVDGSGVTQPISGTVSAAVSGTVGASQSGTWTVQPGNTANTTAWKVDGSAVTQPVSAASLPLPTGAAAAAKQPALGTAGTPSADIISVQGAASMTALKVDGSGVTQPVSGTVSATAYSAPSNGYVSVGTSDVQMPSLACSYLQIKALKSNTGTIYVGTGSGVASTVTGSTNTTTGLELAASETTGWMPVSNANLFYLIASAASQGVTYAVMH